MDGITTATGSADIEAALIQITKVKETADHLAKDDAPEGADQFRILAGLVHQLAEQMERLAMPMRAPIPPDGGFPEDGAR